MEQTEIAQKCDCRRTFSAQCTCVNSGSSEHLRGEHVRVLVSASGALTCVVVLTRQMELLKPGASHCECSGEAENKSVMYRNVTE